MNRENIFVTSNDKGYHNYIFEAFNKNEIGYKNYICDGRSFVISVNSDLNWEINGWKLRRATSEEVQWLEACVRTNRFIPFKELNINNELNYEIC